MSINNVAASDIVLEVSDFVALANQTFEYAFSGVTIRGELANFRVSKGKWVYFDLKDSVAMVRFFGTVFTLPGPIEDGMVLRVRGTPHMHPQYGFSITASSIQPEGTGTIRRAAELLQAKLEAEGLFDIARKRLLVYPPIRIGLVTSTESAAYADFIKVLSARWGGLVIECADVQVQGEIAPAQIVAALDYFNQQAEAPEVIVITRGGGSPEDLYAFSTERVTRAVAASRIPTLVAIGHEVDISLAELAADQRASTPSNAAELLVPHRSEVQSSLQGISERLQEAGFRQVQSAKQQLDHSESMIGQILNNAFRAERNVLVNTEQLLRALDPHAVLKRGFAIVRHNGKVITHQKRVIPGVIVNIEVSDGSFEAQIC